MSDIFPVITSDQRKMLVRSQTTFKSLMMELDLKRIRRYYVVDRYAESLFGNTSYEVVLRILNNWEFNKLDFVLIPAIPAKVIPIITAILMIKLPE